MQVHVSPAPCRQCTPHLDTYYPAGVFWISRAQTPDCQLNLNLDPIQSAMTLILNVSAKHPCACHCHFEGQLFWTNAQFYARRGVESTTMGHMKWNTDKVLAFKKFLLFQKNVWSKSKEDCHPVWRHHWGPERHLQRSSLAVGKGERWRWCR